MAKKHGLKTFVNTASYAKRMQADLSLHLLQFLIDGWSHADQFLTRLNTHKNELPGGSGEPSCIQHRSVGAEIFVIVEARARCEHLQNPRLPRLEAVLGKHLQATPLRYICSAKSVSTMSIRHLVLHCQEELCMIFGVVLVSFAMNRFQLCKSLRHHCVRKCKA